MQRVHIQHDFTAPPERVFAYLAEHEHLEPLLGAKITRLSDGTDGQRNGVGSSRKMKIGPLPSFVETTTRVVPNEVIEYKITQGSPLKDHIGTMTFSPTPSGGTHFDYLIEFGSKIPGVDVVVAKGLTKGITDGLKKVEPQI